MGNGHASPRDHEPQHGSCFGVDERQERRRDHAQQRHGVLPVIEGNHLAGVVTDRDIVVRVIAEGKAVADCVVGDVMTEEVHYCLDDNDVEDRAHSTPPVDCFLEVHCQCPGWCHRRCLHSTLSYRCRASGGIALIQIKDAGVLKSSLR
ncbi:MAG TPA: CBS domain-containing protein [Stellaceae bacterium]|nr:CBS domain-containing protein [Stellaceae bacterium]